MRAKWFVLALCVGAFCIAMGLRHEINIWIGTGAAAVVCISLLFAVRRPTTGSTNRWPPPSVLAIGAAAGVAMSVATLWLYPISIALFPPIEQEVQMLYQLLRQPPGPIYAFPLLVIVVTAEELLWRGLAIDLFSERFGPWRSVVLSALIYVLPQIAFRSPLLMVVALLCGLVWGALRVRCRSVAAPLAAHIVWDLLVFVLYPLA